MGVISYRTYTYEPRPEEWTKARIGKITSSLIPDMVPGKKVHTTQLRKGRLAFKIQSVLIERLTGKPFREKHPSNVQMSDVECIEETIEQYTRLTGNTVEPATQFYDHPSYEMVGASPHGFITTQDQPTKGLLHINVCRYYRNLWHVAKASEESEHPREVLQDTEYAKVQFIMDCTRTKWCDYVIRNELASPSNFYASVNSIERTIRVEIDRQYLNSLWKRIVPHIRYLKHITKRLTDAE